RSAGGDRSSVESCEIKRGLTHCDPLRSCGNEVWLSWIPTLTNLDSHSEWRANDGDRVTIATQRNAPADLTALQDGDPIAPVASDAVTVRTRIDGDSATNIETADDTQPETATASDGGSVVMSSLAIAEIHAGAAGDDRENPTDEYVVFENTRDDALGISRWMVEDEAGHGHTVPDGVTLAAANP
uniref:lamin tail domain-containing protein n=1 Tax=Haloparvum sedimenti TaxID=1678448 RepID=UPI001C401026